MIKDGGTGVVEGIIDADGIDLNGVTVLKHDETVRGVQVSDILMEWNNVKRNVGNPSLVNPILLNDVKFPIHFGITINWSVVMNMASCPDELDGPELLQWLKNFPMHHEMGHYFICPYDGVTNARLGMAVLGEWKSAAKDEVMAIVNYFSDIIINVKMMSIVGEEYFKCMKAWIWHVIRKTIKSGYGISPSFMTFTKVHELLWKRRFNAFKYPEWIEEAARKISSAISFSDSWTESISIMTKVLKDIMINEKNDNKGSTKDVLSDEIGDSMSKDGKEGDGKTKGTDEGDQDGTVPSQKKLMVTLKKDGKYKDKPFDMTILMGNTGEEKTKGSLDKLERENDEEKVLSIIEKTGMPFKPSKSLMEFMNIAKDANDAWRLWLRAKAIGLFDYDTMTTKKKKGKVDLPCKWNWEDPIEDWKVLKSVNSFPPFPFPPMAKGVHACKKGVGNRTLPDARDILIVRDSSSSTATHMEPSEGDLSILSEMKESLTVFNISSIAAMAALHAAIRKGAKFSVINFSSKAVSTNGWLSPTKENVYKAEKTILQYQGNLTNLPIPEMKELLSKVRNCFVLIITDSLVSNWNEFFMELDYFVDRGHRFSMLFVKLKTTPTDIDFVGDVKSKDMSINVVHGARDLLGITLDEINSVYN